MRVFYLLSDYISHARAGGQYLRCLKSLGHDRVDRPEDADVCLVHDEPHLVPAHFERWPGLRKRPVAGYFVWELERLPRLFEPGVALVDEIWTCSAFSAAAYAGYARSLGIETRVLPHVVDRVVPSLEDVVRMRARLGLEVGRMRGVGQTVFYTVCDAGNARKNVLTLLRAFARLPRGAARLVVKQYRSALDLSALTGVVSVPEVLAEGEMAALHALCDCYVSPHRGEAWGLGLGEAMSHGKIVLATGWSGNMEFMNGENSVCLGYALRPIGAEDLRALPPVFEVGMRWAEVDEDKLGACMMDVAAGRLDPALARRARASMARFSRRAVADVLDALLHGLAARGKRYPARAG